jgi:hypothetical protein
MSRTFIFTVLAYLVPTFILGFVWHLKAFDGYYKSLEMYRRDVIIPFGLLSMVLQGVVFAWAYPRLVADPTSLAAGFRFAAGAALLSWTFTTLAVGAKHVMTSVPRFVRIETAFTIAQFLFVALLFPLVSRVG